MEKKEQNINLYPQAATDRFGRSGIDENEKQIPIKYGYVNHPDGEFVIAPRFDMAGEFSNKIVPEFGYLAIVEENGKYGIIKPDGTYFIKPEFSKISHFSEGFAAVKINWNKFEGEWGFIKPDGSYLVPPVFELAEDFHYGYAKVKTAENARLFTKPDGSRILKSLDDITDNITNEEDFDNEKVIGLSFKCKEGYIDLNGHWHDFIPKSGLHTH